MSIPLGPEALRTWLRISMDALQRRRASEIPESIIDRLVDLDWLEWSGGSLRLTTTGENIYRRELAQFRAGSEPGAAATPKPDSQEALMATKPNYQFEKRQREIAKQKKKEEKAQRKTAPRPDEPDDVKKTIEA